MNTAGMITVTPLTFHRGSTRLVGRLYRNTPDWTVRQPGVLVTGSWLTVKEQMPDLYARQLAELGYTAFTFDFSGFGESEGEPRQAELPDRKIGDLIAAADFLSTLSPIEPRSVAHLAVCASAQYGLAALARGARIARFVSIAGWFHDLAGLRPFYGGEAGIAERLDAGQPRRAHARDVRHRRDGARLPGRRHVGGDVLRARLLRQPEPWCGPVVAQRDGAPCRGPTGSCSTACGPRIRSHDAGPVHPLGRLRLPRQRPFGARLPARAKRLVWSDGTQTDYYDQPAQVRTAVAATDAFLKEGRG